jgi:hypothetical protein
LFDRIADHRFWDCERRRERTESPALGHGAGLGHCGGHPDRVFSCHEPLEDGRAEIKILRRGLLLRKVDTLRHKVEMQRKPVSLQQRIVGVGVNLELERTVCFVIQFDGDEVWSEQRTERGNCFVRHINASNEGFGEAARAAAP